MIELATQQPLDNAMRAKDIVLLRGQGIYHQPARLRVGLGNWLGAFAFATQREGTYILPNLATCII